VVRSSAASDVYKRQLQDRSYLTDTVYTTVNVNKLSDINFLKDFLPHDMRRDPNPESVLAATKWDEDYTLTLQTRLHLNRDFDSAGKLPELALDVKRQPFLDSGIFYEGESSVGKLSRRFGLGQPAGLTTDFDTVREDTFHQWTLPKTFGGWLSVVPRVGIRATHYSSSIFDPTLLEGSPNFSKGGSLTRFAANTGVEASFKFSRTFEQVENRKWGLDGLRHIVQPFTDLSIVASDHDTSRILPFDHYSATTKLPAIDFPQFNTIDSITDWQILRLGVRNRLQTRRDDQTLNWLELESFIDTNIQRPEYSKLPAADGGTFSNFSNRLRWNPLPWLKVTLDSQLPLLDQGFTEFDSNTSFQVTRDLTVQLGNRFLSGNRTFADSNLVSGGARLRINDNWAVAFHNSYDFATKVAESQQYSIDRDLRSWIASFMVVVREQDAKKDIAVLLSLTLKDIPKISLPIKYDTGAMDGTASGKNR
jgi:LPS-assembly protein